MKKGIYTWFGIPMPEEDCYRAIREAGFETVMVDWSGDFPENIVKEKNVDLAEKYALQIENGHLSFKDINTMWLEGTDGDDREASLKSDIILAGKCKVPVLVIHATSGATPPSVNEIGLKRFGRLIEAAEKAGVRLAFENLRSAVYLDAVFDRFGDADIGFCYDAGHRNCRTPHENYLEKYRNRVIAVHLHDNDGREDQHLLPFEGTIDWQAEMSALAKTSYGGSLTLESATIGPDEHFLKSAAERADRLMELYRAQ